MALPTQQEQEAVRQQQREVPIKALEGNPMDYTLEFHIIVSTVQKNWNEQELAKREKANLSHFGTQET